MWEVPIVVVFGFMAIVSVGASVTGQGAELCKAMGGIYTPANVHVGADVCPGGHWLNLGRQPQPTK